jgi:hypothetical protein
MVHISPLGFKRLKPRKRLPEHTITVYAVAHHVMRLTGMHENCDVLDSTAATPRRWPFVAFEKSFAKRD